MVGAGERIAVTVLLGSLLLLGGCGGQSASRAPGQRPGPTPGALEVRLEGTEFKWNPRTVTVRPGQRVRFRVVNKGAIAHTFVSDPAGIRETAEIPPGGELTAEWTAPLRPGSLPFWCGVPGHREAGMEGTLVVK